MVYRYLLKSVDVDRYGQHDYKPYLSFKELETGITIQDDKKRSWKVYEEMTF